MMTLLRNARRASLQDWVGGAIVVLLIGLLVTM